MASFAEVVSSKAGVDSYRAAEHALPINLRCAMDLACLLSGTKSLKLAILTPKMFFLCLLCSIHLLLTVDHTAEVWLLAIETLVERTSVHGIGFEIPIKVREQSCFFFKSLFSSNLYCLVLDLYTKISNFFQLGIDKLGFSISDRLLA